MCANNHFYSWFLPSRTNFTRTARCRFDQSGRSSDLENADIDSQPLLNPLSGGHFPNYQAPTLLPARPPRPLTGAERLAFHPHGISRRIQASASARLLTSKWLAPARP